MQRDNVVSLFTIVAVLVLIAYTVSTTSVYGQSTRMDEVQERLAANAAREQALSALGTDVEVRYGDYGTIRMIKGKLKLPAINLEDIESSVADLNATLRLPLGFAGAESLEKPRVIKGKDGRFTLRLQQAINGRRVVGAMVAIRYQADKSVRAIFATTGLDHDLPRIPAIGSDEAAGRMATAAFPGRSMAEVSGLRVVYLLQRGHPPALAWAGYARAGGEFSEAYKVFVDALSGETLAVWPLQVHAKHRIVHTANDTTNYDDANNELGDESDPPDSGQGKKAFDHTGTAYDFFASYFGHTAFIGDTSGSDEFIRSTVHACKDGFACPWTNASFLEGAGGDHPTKSRLIFGSGDAPVGNFAPASISQDAVVHEYVHGLTRGIVDVVGGIGVTGEAGGINEAFSDIFAAVVHASQNDFEPNDDSTWWIAEDWYKPSDQTVPLRDMYSPADTELDFPGMDDYLDPNFSSSFNHEKSGVISLAFRLLSTGGTHPEGVTSNSVSQIGIEKSADIFFNALGFLTGGGNDSYPDLRGILVDSAENLYGGTEAMAVHQAFDAVRVGGATPPPMPASVSTSLWYCYGWYTVSWPSSSGATDYQLNFSPTQSYPNGWILYVGPNTSVDVNVEADGYVGVRACNSGGCSDYRGHGYVERLDYCM